MDNLDFLNAITCETREKQNEWQGDMQLAIMKRTYYSCPPWVSPKRLIKENDLCYVIPAYNQPKDGRIQFWTIPITGLEEWAVDAVDCYGIGLATEDIEII